MLCSWIRSSCPIHLIGLMQCLLLKSQDQKVNEPKCCLILKTSFFFFLFSFFLSSLFFPFFNTWQNILYTDSELVVNLDNSPINALKSKLMVGETKADVQLDGNWHFFFVDKRFWLFQSMRPFLHIIANVGEVTVISLDNLQTFESDSRFSEEELVDFVSRDFSFTICSLLNFC